MAKKLIQEEIYKAAINIFSIYGFKRTRVEDVAGELEVVTGTLYRYVKDKKDLYEKSVAWGIKQWQGRVLDAVKEVDDVVEQFRIMCVKGYGYLEKDKALRHIMINDPTIFPLSPRKTRFPEIDTASISLIKSILQNGIDQGRFRTVDIDETANLLYSIYVMFIIKTYIKSEESSTRQMFENGIDLILNGLMKIQEEQRGGE